VIFSKLDAPRARSLASLGTRSTAFSTISTSYPFVLSMTKPPLVSLVNDTRPKAPASPGWVRSKANRRKLPMNNEQALYPKWMIFVRIQLEATMACSASKQDSTMPSCVGNRSPTYAIESDECKRHIAPPLSLPLMPVANSHVRSRVNIVSKSTILLIVYDFTIARWYLTQPVLCPIHASMF